MTNNGGFQSDFSGGGGIYQRSQTYTPSSPNFPPQQPNYPPQQPNYPPQQPNYPPQTPNYPPPPQQQNYNRANTYMPTPPNPYLAQQPYMQQAPPPYGHANTMVPPPYPNYPPQPVPPSPYGRTNTFMPPAPVLPAVPLDPTPIIRAPTAPMPMAYGTNYNPEADCQILHNAVHGLGTDERAIIGVIVNRNGPQRTEIRRCYKSMYGKDLIERLKEDTSGNFKEVIAGMFMTPAEYDAVCLYKAMKGLGTNEGVLIEII